MEQHAQDGTGANSCTSTNIYVNNCKHRLPCGVCELTNQKCPLLWSTDPIWPNPYVTWTTTTTGGPDVTIKKETVHTINTNGYEVGE